MSKSNALLGRQDQRILSENVKGGSHANMIVLARCIVELPEASKLSEQKLVPQGKEYEDAPPASVCWSAVVRPARENWMTQTR